MNKKPKSKLKPMLESEFDELAKEINEKIKTAAESLKSARELAKKGGIDRFHVRSYFEEDYDDDDLDKLDARLSKINLSDLELEIDLAGWSSSIC